MVENFEHYIYLFITMSISFRGSETVIPELALMKVIQQSRIILASGNAAIVKDLTVFVFHCVYMKTRIPWWFITQVF